jgi:hypothetical protein
VSVNEGVAPTDKPNFDIEIEQRLPLVWKKIAGVYLMDRILIVRTCLERHKHRNKESALDGFDGGTESQLLVQKGTVSKPKCICRRTALECAKENLSKRLKFPPKQNPELLQVYI